MRTNYTLLAASTLFALAGCGGGTDTSTTIPTSPPAPAPVAATPEPAPSVSVPVPQPTTSISADLQSFAAAWISYNMVQIAPTLQLAAGATDACPVGGTARYDVTTQVETLVACGIKQFPEHTFTGSFAVNNLATSNGRTFANISAPHIAVATAATGQTEFTLDSGDIGGDVTDSINGDVYYFASQALSFSAGQSHHYTVSNAGATSITILVSNGVPDRTTTNLVFTTSNGSNTLASPNHEPGTRSEHRASRSRQLADHPAGCGPGTERDLRSKQHIHAERRRRRYRGAYIQLERQRRTSGNQRGFQISPAKPDLDMKIAEGPLSMLGNASMPTAPLTPCVGWPQPTSMPCDLTSCHMCGAGANTALLQNRGRRTTSRGRCWDRCRHTVPARSAKILAHRSYALRRADPLLPLFNVAGRFRACIVRSALANARGKRYLATLPSAVVKRCVA
jgi:hypothetical protein